MNKEKKMYEAPAFFIMEVKSEGIICASGSGEFFIPGSIPCSDF